MNFRIQNLRKIWQKKKKMEKEKGNYKRYALLYKNLKKFLQDRKVCRVPLDCWHRYNGSRLSKSLYCINCKYLPLFSYIPLSVTWIVTVCRTILFIISVLAVCWYNRQVNEHSLNIKVGTIMCQNQTEPRVTRSKNRWDFAFFVFIVYLCWHYEYTCDFPSEKTLWI